MSFDLLIHGDETSCALEDERHSRAWLRCKSNGRIDFEQLHQDSGPLAALPVVHLPAWRRVAGRQKSSSDPLRVRTANREVYR